MKKNTHWWNSPLHFKFVIVYLAFGFLSLFSALILTSGYFYDRLVEHTASQLYKTVNITATNYLPRFFQETVPLSEVRSHLNGLEISCDGMIWFLDSEGQLIFSTHSEDYPTAPLVIEDFDPAECAGRLYLQGNYHGFFEEEVITVMAPVVNGFTTEGYLAIHKYTSSVDSLYHDFMYRIYIVLALIYVLSFSILIAYDYMVYYPLRKIAEAAKQYALGNLDYVIPIETEDEMGYLSASLNYMASHLRDMEDYQKKFVANVSHDFRSPLTSIKGYVEAMVDGTIPPEFQEKYLKIILFETERLTDLTRDLLELNAFDTKNLLLNRTKFDLHDVIRSTVSTFEGTCTNKKITIELLFATKHLSVNADVQKIQRVLYNLIDNAIKFSNPDSIITIETTERGDKVFTSVKDDGVGIPRDSLNKIWERFYKSDLSRGKDKKGTGLGLSIVKETIQAHGENINVISTEGVGTEFTFSLPKA